ncbi:unnamed protein product [Rotaria sp. Silwood2]|nr:unnamed protein product [Rotaria sp. Silwood2]
MYTSLVKITKTTNINVPTFEKYSQLYSTHLQALTCPCTTISIDYKKFLNVEYTFHQVCSSIYVTNDWINYIAPSFGDQPYDPPNFVWTSTNIFQALSAFCELTNKTISKSLNRFYSNQYISAMITPVHIFESQIQSMLEQFIYSTTNHFLLSLQTIRDTTQANALLSAKQTNILVYFLYENTIATVAPLYYDDCDCGYSAKCIVQSFIYSYPNLTELFSIPGQYVGCFPLESLLQSTLECFYNQTCVDILHSYLVFNSSMNVTALDASLPSRFFVNSTIQELVNKLMVEQWNRSTMYERYFNSCQPISCTYNYATRNDIIYIITTLLGLIGGMVTVLELFVPLLVKLARWKKRAPTEQTETDTQQQNPSLFSKFKHKLLTLNMFQSVPPSTNEFEIQNERISTRLYIILCIVLTIALVGYISLISITKTATVKVSTFKKYSQLYATHSKALICPCKTISINYKKLLHVEYTFHQVCSSIFVTDKWINYTDGRTSKEIVGVDDFRWSGMNTFRALRAFCELTHKITSEGLTQFFSNQYVSAIVIPSYLFESQIQLMLEQFISSTTNDLLSSLQIIRDTNQANGLWGIAGIQYSLRRQTGTDSLHLTIHDYFGCSCGSSAKCIRQATIYNYFNRTTLFSIPGLYIGCYAIEALLQSTLECFYNQTCIHELQSFLTLHPRINVTALDSTSPSRFLQNSTIQELVDKSMIEKWNRTIMHESYFNACQPTQCIYSYTTRNDILYIITTVLGLTGGLITIAKFISPLLVKLVRRKKRPSSTQSENNNDQPTIGLCQTVVNFCRNFNLYSSVLSSNNEWDLRNERIATRLYILLLCLSTIILVMYTSLVKITKTANINVPTFENYSQLYSTHLQALTCPCTTISIDYKKFLNVEYTFHQVCSSIYVTSDWRESILLFSPHIPLYVGDFRALRKFFFQALSTFCELTNQTVSESLTRFYSNRYISATVISSDLFHLQMQSIFKQFVSLTTNDLLLSLEIIRDTTQVNALFSGRWTNYNLLTTFAPRFSDLKVAAQLPQEYSKCRCDVSMTCIEQATLKNVAHSITSFAIPGIYRGCFIIESLLQSTLECFYNQTCVDKLHSYLAFNSSMNTTALDSSVSSRFFVNSTIEELVNKLMIERWNLSRMYANYYNACQPISCTYNYATRNDIIYIVTIVFGLVGGIVTIFKIILPSFVRLIAYCFRKRQRVTPDVSHIPIQ